MQKIFGAYQGIRLSVSGYQDIRTSGIRLFVFISPDILVAGILHSDFLVS